MADGRSRVLRFSPSGALHTLTGAAAAFGLSAVGALAGGIVAGTIDGRDLIPDRFIPALWALIAGVGTIAAGATVAESAGRHASRSVAIAGGLLFLAVYEIMLSVESTGVEGAELQTVFLVPLAYIALLALGIWLHRRRARRRSD
ncbi:MAG: hypothetical protein JWN29_3777 [Acidimicrobiales bacterium]|nr:hypothetical protein [Acidimicrobiales bacterium]